MIIQCPHCGSEIEIAHTALAGDRIYHARCGRWLLIGRWPNGVYYGVRVGPPVSYPKEKRR